MSERETNEFRTAGRAPAAWLRVGLYTLVVMSPLWVAMASQPETDHPFVQELAKNFALIGYTILALQFVLSARFHWVERPFGLDIVFRFHRQMGLFAAALLLAHPVLYASADEWDLLLGLDHSWGISLGKIAFVALGVLVGVSVFRKAIRLEFETWRGIHNGLAISVLLLGFVHSLNVGGDFDRPPIWALWGSLLFLALGSYAHHKGLLPGRLSRHSYRVVRVDRETDDVWSLELAPNDGTAPIQNLPGQFGFLTLLSAGGSIEEHPFTIASAPNASGNVVTTIKTSGDYTATIGQTQVGDPARFFGPYGRFSYSLHPEEEDLVFIAGGVGITPMLSMLRHMRAERKDLSVLLLYGNRRDRDIIARAELESIATDGHPRLEIVHVLSRADEDWTGETGHIDEALLQRQLDRIRQRAYYVCGPPALTADVTSALVRLGASERSIHVEPFSL